MISWRKFKEVKAEYARKLSGLGVPYFYFRTVEENAFLEEHQDTPCYWTVPRSQEETLDIFACALEYETELVTVEQVTTLVDFYIEVGLVVVVPLLLRYAYEHNLETEGFDL